MLTHFHHVTIVVRDVAKAKAFLPCPGSWSSSRADLDDVEAEARRLTASGIELRNEIMEFSRSQAGVFLSGPVELAQWLKHQLARETPALRLFQRVREGAGLPGRSSSEP